MLLDGDNDGGTHALGRMMEPGKVSCSGCHVPDGGFSDTRTLGGQLSLGAAWGKRRAPSLLDVGQAKILMWDGRHDALYNQPFGPIEGYFEMNSSRLYTAQQIAARYGSDYQAVLGALPDLSRTPSLSAEHAGCDFSPQVPPPVCHGRPGDHAEYDSLSLEDQNAVTQVVVNFGKALGAYERRLTCGPSRFDGWVRGQASLSDSEERGARLFVGRAGCVSCHAGPFLSDQKFHNVGLRPLLVSAVFVDAGDEGASAGLAAAKSDPLAVNGVFSDGDDGRLSETAPSGAFRTPTLRCVSSRPSFMHTGQLRSLEEVVAFFAAGGDPFGYPGASELRPLESLGHRPGRSGGIFARARRSRRRCFRGSPDRSDEDRSRPCARSSSLSRSSFTAGWPRRRRRSSEPRPRAVRGRTRALQPRRLRRARCASSPPATCSCPSPSSSSTWARPIASSSATPRRASCIRSSSPRRRPTIPTATR